MHNSEVSSDKELKPHRAVVKVFEPPRETTMASFESKLVELFLRLTDRRKEGLHRFINWMVSPRPPRKMYEKYKIDEKQVNGQNVFTLSPKARAGEHHILYLHGGAYIRSFCKQHWHFLGRLIDELDCTVIAPDYPLAPKHTYKDAFAMVLPILTYDFLIILIANIDCLGILDSYSGTAARKYRSQSHLLQFRT